MLATLLAAVVILIVGEAVVASVTSVLWLQRLGPNTAKFVSDQTRLATDDPMAGAALAWARFLPAPDSASDSTAAGWMRELLGLAPGRGGALPAYPIRPADVVGTGGSVLPLFVAAEAGTLPAGLRDTLAMLADHPRTALFRRIARVSSAVRLLAATGEPFSATPMSGARPAHTTPLEDAVLANTAGAVVAVANHDWRAATARIGETAAFALQLLRAPDVRTNQIGFRILRYQVLGPLAQLARRRASGVDSATVADAARLLDQAVPFANGAAGLMVNPADALQFTAAVQNPDVPAGYRVIWLLDGWAGLCANPWEVLTGPSGARKQAMLAAADVMSDVPHARSLAAFGAGYWELGAPEVGHTSLAHTLLERGPWGVLWRVRQCANAI